MLPMQGAQVRSLVRELRSHMPCSTEEEEKKETTYGMGEDFCNVTNKGLYVSNIQKQLIQLSIKENK